MSLLNYFAPKSASSGLQTKAAASSRSNPLKLVSWNVNGLVTRISSKSVTDEWADFISWVEQHDPDLICLQEVKLAAHGARDSTKGDGKPRDRGVPRENTKPFIADMKLVHAELNKKPLNGYHRFWSLSDWRYSGVLILLKKDIKVKSVRFNLTSSQDKANHHEDGRVICLEFENFVFLGTYSPNHGWDTPHWLRRDQWDAECTHWLSNRADYDLAKPLIWMGDLNVAPTDMDLSHPVWFRSQAENAATCPPERLGQPGCADIEREGFEAFLSQGALVDAYRKLHSEGPKVISREQSPDQSDPRVSLYDAENNLFSWRGTPGVEDPRFGRFYGKAMRIDHCLVSEVAKEFVETAEYLGEGSQRKNFWGSDHSPMLVTLNKAAVQRNLKKRKLEGEPS